MCCKCLIVYLCVWIGFLILITVCRQLIDEVKYCVAMIISLCLSPRLSLQKIFDDYKVMMRVIHPHCDTLAVVGVTKCVIAMLRQNLDTVGRIVTVVHECSYWCGDVSGGGDGSCGSGNDDDAVTESSVVSSLLSLDHCLFDQPVVSVHSNHSSGSGSGSGSSGSSYGYTHHQTSSSSYNYHLSYGNYNVSGSDNVYPGNNNISSNSSSSSSRLALRTCPPVLHDILAAPAERQKTKLLLVDSLIALPSLARATSAPSAGAAAAAAAVDDDEATTASATGGAAATAVAVDVCNVTVSSCELAVHNLTHLLPPPQPDTRVEAGGRGGAGKEAGVMDLTVWKFPSMKVGSYEGKKDATYKVTLSFTQSVSRSVI